MGGSLAILKQKKAKNREKTLCAVESLFVIILHCFSWKDSGEAILNMKLMVMQMGTVSIEKP